ncbi:hypothetical protein IF2G_05228 [Cordyceps javanica]|nr:hypothetical protein IF2G_05228 [Cordyceps javanica]
MAMPRATEQTEMASQLDMIGRVGLGACSAALTELADNWHCLRYRVGSVPNETAWGRHETQGPWIFDNGESGILQLSVNSKVISLRIQKRLGLKDPAR